MSVKDRKKWETILTKWTPFFIIACGLIGIVLGSFLAYFFQGEFPYDVFAGGLVATIILIIIQVIKQKRKKDNLPEADERVIHNVFRFFAYASHLSLAILFIALAVFTLLGNESISILYLWIFFFSYIWIFGIGAILIKRR
ncbi:hypothetical protein [Caldibacillus thermoamylovorans]|uniref:DUF2178 domain-containing protein n=1 Tax=Caldibacillus thermoamylovorans TaxID=35841 RepID=A0ABD4A6T7_9BACI|nr:hypothetical protein [Caldibacillus thermoamylovorans]KIO63384.1 hypothetical protein B4166_0210 [Caldibacillus thermoamylovorans]KIO72917.1 hypothetical protein B4167_2560 [Caldibacillus thermoamylovorans]